MKSSVLKCQSDVLVLPVLSDETENAASPSQLQLPKDFPISQHRLGQPQVFSINRTPSKCRFSHFLPLFLRDQGGDIPPSATEVCPCSIHC